jgi:sporulation protein YlmC with PRC-barrel domain
MKLYRTLAVGFSLAAFSGGYALAQQTQPQTGQQQQQAQAPQKQEQQKQKQAQRMSPDQMKVSDLKGKDVYDRDGSEIGEIEELVLDLPNHRVHAAVVQVGGLVGGKKFAFPLTDFKFGEKDRLVLDIDEQRMKNAEGFAKGQWPEMGNEYWGRTPRQADAGAHTGAAPGSAAPSGAAHSGAAPTSPAQASAGGPASAGGQGGTGGQASPAPKNLVRTGDLVGKNIQDRAGEEVGQVEEVLVSLNDASIKGIRISIDKGGETTVDPKMLTAGLDKKLVSDTPVDELRRRSEQERGAERAQTPDSSSDNRPMNPQR